MCARRRNAQGWHAPSGRLCVVAVTEMGLDVPRGALRTRTFLVLQIIDKTFYTNQGITFISNKATTFYSNQVLGLCQRYQTK